MSDSLPEPTNVGPIAGGNLRASDADREQVATVLSTAYAEGRLTREEHDERLDQLLVGQDLRRPDPDHPGSGRRSAPASARRAGHRPEQRLHDRHHLGHRRPATGTIAVFGGVTRTGKWRVRKNIQSLALFGGIDLDLREAIFESPVVEISGFWCFGGLDIKVPAGIEVRDQTAGIFGGTDVRDVGDPLPGAPDPGDQGHVPVRRCLGARARNRTGRGSSDEPRPAPGLRRRPRPGDRGPARRVRRGPDHLDEHEERTEAALNARTFDDLTALTTDLVPAADGSRAGPGSTGARTATNRTGSPRCWPRPSATGPWRVRRTPRPNVFMGSVTLDLTEATFAGPVDRGQLHPVPGPASRSASRSGTTVRIEAANVLGDTSVKDIGEPDRGHARPSSSAAPTSSATSVSAAPRSRRSGGAT